jgi:hypothetical protein
VGPFFDYQGDDELHMVSVVESMRRAAEEHDRMLLECAILKARVQHCDDFIFDMDLAGPCSSFAPISMQQCIAV